MRISTPGMARPEVVAMVWGSSPARHMATTPVASVRPYPVTTVSNPRSVCMRRTISSGTDAAPVTASRSEVRSTS